MVTMTSSSSLPSSHLNNNSNHQQEQQQQYPSANLHHATITLCLCTFVQAYLLISVFPYAGYMVIHLFRTTNDTNNTTAKMITSENAGTYAGILSSSFMVGRFMGSYPWGKCADMYGRKFVLIWSLVGSGLGSIGFGFSNSFTMAVILRFLLGLVNSIIGTTKTVVSELSYLQHLPSSAFPHANETENEQQQQREEEQRKLNKKRESKMMGLVVGMRGWGYLMAPAIGGFLSEPLQRFPDSKLIRYCCDGYGNHDNDETTATACHWLLSHYPFVLPNIIGMIFCFVTAWAVYVYIEETLPIEQRRDGKYLFLDLAQFLCAQIKGFFKCCCCGWNYGSTGKGNMTLSEEESYTIKEESQNLLPLTTTPQMKATTYASTSSQNDQRNDDISNRHNIGSSSTSLASQPSVETATSTPPPTPTMRSIWSRPKTRHHLESYGLFSFIVTCVDEAFPLYCISQTGGLGLSEQSIGSILSGAGILFAFFQYGVYSIVVAKFGLYKSLKIGCLVGIMPIILIPLSMLWKEDKVEGGDVENNEYGDKHLNWKIYTFLVLVLGISKIFCCLFFASVSVAMNQSVPLSSRGTMNGIATLMGSLGKGLGPTFSGWLVAFCISSGVGGLKPRVGSVLIFVTIFVLGLLVFFGLDEGSDECQKQDEKKNERGK